MNIHEFTQKVIGEIKSGIDSANQVSATYKAHYPKDIEFDIALTESGDICLKDAEIATRMKFTLHLSHYPWEKK
jgi:hypothetical protein